MRFTENFALRTTAWLRRGSGETQRIKPRTTFNEWNRGDIVEVFSAWRSKDIELFVSEGVVQVLDKDMNPSTWDEIQKQFEPIQIPVQKRKVKQ